MNNFLTDLRFAIRQLAAKPGFTAAAILTLALGIGANTAVFSVLSGYLLKPLPYPHSDQLVKINTSLPKTENGLAHLSVPEYLAVKNNAHAFSATAAYIEDWGHVETGGASTVSTVAYTSASLFKVLGIQPRMGRVFTAANMVHGRSHVALISDRMWRSRFGGRPDIVGKTFRMNGHVYRILGVMPPDFAFPQREIALWAPFTIDAGDKASSNMFHMYLTFIGRLRPGATIETLRQQLHTAVRTDIARVMAPDAWQQAKDAGFSLVARPWRETLVADKTASLWLLQGAVLLLLLIACVNVANLLLSRTLARSHELAMRSALGASRRVLARQLLVEGLCLVVPGGIAGVGLGWLGLHFLAQSAFNPGGDPFSLAFDWRVALFALGAVCLTLILVSLLPIRHLGRVNLSGLLQAGGRTLSGGRGSRRLRAALVAAELTLATALLAASGLLLHSFANLESVNTGFRKDNVLIATLVIPPNHLSTDAALSGFYSEVRRQAQTLPGVRTASIADHTELSGGGNTSSFTIRGHQQRTSYRPSTQQNTVDGAYFRALGIPLLRGRNFDARDTQHSQPVVIVDKNFARQYFPHGDAIGQQIQFGDAWYTIVGVAAPVQYQYLTGPNKPLVYLNSHQDPSSVMVLVLHTKVPPVLLEKPLHRLVAGINPTVSIYRTETMQHRIGRYLGDQRTTMALLLAFAVIALALAIVGVYGVMSYAVGQRRAECGIRLALGALPKNLLWMIIRDGLKLLAIGLVIGLVLAVTFGAVLSSHLFGVSPYDPLTLIGTIIVLSTITLIACYLPARRASKLAPATAIMEQ